VDIGAKPCDTMSAFVALVKPLDLLEGLQVHTCGPFLFGLKAVGKHQIAQTEKRNTVERTRNSKVVQCE